MEPHEREALLIRTFVVASKRERFVEQLASAKRRRKFLDGLHHFADFDPRFVVPVGATLHTSEALVAELRRRGAGGPCHLISARSALDGRAAPLEAAIDDVFAVAEGTLVCCVPGVLAYFEGEGARNRFILHRPRALR